MIQYIDSIPTFLNFIQELLSHHPGKQAIVFFPAGVHFNHLKNLVKVSY